MVEKVIDWVEAYVGERPYQDIMSIRDHVISKFEHNQFPHFTKHDVGHSDRVCECIYKIFEEKRVKIILSKTELIILILSAYLHDVSLQVPIAHGITTAVNAITPDELKKIRERHGEVSAEMIRNSIKNEKDEYNLGILNKNLKPLMEYVADLCEKHQSSQPYNPLYKENRATNFDNNSTIRIGLLTGLLRIADELDCDSRRVGVDDLNDYEIPIDSKMFWFTAYYIDAVTVESGTITFYISHPENTPETIANYMFDSVTTKVEKELQYCGKCFHENDLFIRETTEKKRKKGLNSNLKKPLPDEVIRHVNSLIVQKKTVISSDQKQRKKGLNKIMTTKPERLDLWDSPIYRFRLPKKDAPKAGAQYEDIVIDVTRSAPSFIEPSKELKEILKDIITNPSDYGAIETVMEFGAAKLKNIPYILDLSKDTTVYAVEFKELMENKYSKANIEKCRKFGTRFKDVQFPQPFILEKIKFDLILLLNVVPVMPVFSERMYLLDLLNSRVNEGKYLLWVAQREGSYKPVKEGEDRNCGDGVWMGAGSTSAARTFYKYHNPAEIDEMMGLYGFKFVKKFSNGGSDARLYQKTAYNLFTGILTPDRILKAVPSDFSITDPTQKGLKTVNPWGGYSPIVPNPRSLSIESLYIEKIESMPNDTRNEEYHHVMSYAIGRIFRDSLQGMEIREPKGETEQLDTIFNNTAKTGFFKKMLDEYDAVSPVIKIMNNSSDPTDKDIESLNLRLNTERGKFGLLICSNVEDENLLCTECAKKLPGSCILFLTEGDIKEMLNCSRDDGFVAIDAVMNEKYSNLFKNIC